MNNKLSLGLAVLPFMPWAAVQGEEVRNERPNIILS